MAFDSSVTKRNIMGPSRVHYGTFSQGNTDTGGAISTGLRIVEYFECMAALNVSVSGGDVTVTTADPGGAQAGFWMAIGV